MKVIKFLCITLLIIFLPSFISSGETATFSPYRGYSPEDEIVIARSENTKLFRRENGRFVWRIFLHPVHKLDENKQLVDIDTFPAQPLWNPAQGYSGTVDGLFEYVYTEWMHINEVYFCRAFAQFNTSGIPDGATIDTVKLSLHCRANVLGLGDHDIRSMEFRPSTSGWSTIYNDAYNGDYYVTNYSPWQDTWETWILGDELTDPACVRMKNLLPEDWFSVGLSDWGSGFWSYTIEYYSSGGNVEIPEPTAVNLVSFTASPDFDFVQLNWRTEFEIDNLQWLIERKEENGKYEIIATIAGNNTKPSPTSYSYIDRDVLQGKSYFYRLTDISNYGNKSVHSPVFVKIPEVKGNRLVIYPSMFSKRLSMKVRGFKGNRGKLSIVDKTGRILKVYDLTGKQSPILLTWNAMDKENNRLKNGVYFIRLAIDGNQPETKKVILLK